MKQKLMAILNSSPVFIEIGPERLTAVREDQTIEFTLERNGDGKLTAATIETVAGGLRKFADRKNWQPRIRAFCALPARGLVVRQFSLPMAVGEALEKLLRLQIESEFPLPPEELAWGWCRPETSINDGAVTRQTVLVAALRKETMEEYASLLAATGLQPIFTPAALARNELCPPVNTPHAILETGRTNSELTLFANGMAESVRTVAWGAESANDAVDSLVTAFGKNWIGRKLYLTGLPNQQNEAAFRLHERLGLDGERLDGGAGKTAAIAGLQKAAGNRRHLPWLTPQAKTSTRKFTLFNLSLPDNPMLLKRATVLLGVLILFPYLEALLLKPILAHEVATVRSKMDQMASVVDPELRFLQFLKQSQPPYLDALYVFAQAAPPGARIDSISMNQQGETSLRATFQNAQQVMDFRAKLIANGFFDTLVVEEQSPAPDHQKLSVRMTAKWKNAASRPAIRIDQADKKIAASPPLPGMIPPTPSH